MVVARVRDALGDLPAMVGETYGEWRRHRTIRLGAGLAYYGLFAFVPLLAVSLAVAGVFFSTDEVHEYLSDQLAGLVGSDTGDFSNLMADAIGEVGTVAGLGVIGLLSLAFTASVLVVALQDAFNSIWERPVRSGFRQSLIRRLVAFVVVFASGAVLVASFALNAVSALIGRLVPNVSAVVPLTEIIGTATTWVLAVGVIALLFQYLTEVRAPWPSVLVGSVLTALFVAIGTMAIGAYLRRYAATSIVGATGSIFLVLLWIYYEAQILLAGAEFTRVLVRRRDVVSSSGHGPGAQSPTTG